MENNPILNSHHSEPRWHYATDLKGHFNYEDIRKDCRIFDSVIGRHSIPVQKQGRVFEVNKMEVEYGTHLINLLRNEVGKWRASGYPNATGAIYELLRYWFLNPERHATKNHVNAVADTTNTKEDANFWEYLTAKVLEEVPEVESYLKNTFSDFNIPYVADGKGTYKPDFIIRAKNREVKTVMLILEITGANKQYKAEKKHFKEMYWVPTVNAVRDLYAELVGGEWRFLEVRRE
ncbi:MAG: hypothetical protein H7246_09355 [Phycisphaerae bacterium]|nr:hypothetical protein [Saprospiraceae bacterium]